MEQTAVEWLLNEFQEAHKDYGGLDLEWLKRFEQAKDMEKEQSERVYYECKSCKKELVGYKKEIGFIVKNGKRTETIYSKQEPFVQCNEIIIPKEEPKQETTLEEIAHTMLCDYGIKSMAESINVLQVKKLMVKIAQWQQEQDKKDLDAHLDVAETLWLQVLKQNKRMYSEEEVIKIISKFHFDLLNCQMESTAEWFEQFKNK